MIGVLTIGEIISGLNSKKFSSVDLVNECYEVIDRMNPTLNACITVRDKKDVIREAQKKDSLRVSGFPPLYGIPYVMKDSYLTWGIRTTAASKVLENFIPPYNATVYERLLASGSILIGKMNMDAWGHGGSTENTDFGVARNPWDTTRVAGGSGGGPAIAVATGMAAFAISEDTGGSIRNPAAWCNITGLKVSYGRVSRYGCIAYASSFDTVGPTAVCAEDCAYILSAIAGRDPYDGTSSPKPVPKYTDSLHESIKGKVIGIPKELFSVGLDSDIKDAITVVSQMYKSIGVKIKEISMPLFDYGIAMYYLMAPSETSSNLARYDGIRFGNDRSNFTPETMRRIMIGTYALSAGYYDAYYRQAQKGRSLFIKEYERAFSEVDVLLSPVNPTPPTKIGELLSDPLKNYLADVYTVSANTTGIPALAFPCGFTKSNLPIGAQLTGPMFSEELLLRMVHQYQQQTDWHTRRPIV